jgi:hypothetical protein
MLAMVNIVNPCEFMEVIWLEIVLTTSYCLVAQVEVTMTLANEE